MGGDLEIGSSIPVVRMLNEAEAKSFYIDYLGFRSEWEHRFSPESRSLYMQIRLGAAVIHLNGHAEDDSPVTEVRIPVVGLERLREALAARSAWGNGPSIEDPRYQGKGTDMTLVDPSGNVLVFWARDALDEGGEEVIE